MRVLVASAAIANLDAVQAGTILARAWAALGCEVALVPLGEDGPQFPELLQRFDPNARVVATSSVSELAAFLRDLPDGDGAIYLDLSQLEGLWLGSQLWDELGGAEGIAQLEISLAARQVVGLVPRDDLMLPLTGLHGSISLKGREAGWELPDILDLNREAEAWVADALGAESAGAGAVGGIGAVLQELGVRLDSGLDALLDASRINQSLSVADLVVVGCTQLDFGTMGGPIVTELIQRAANHLRPLVVVSATNYVSSRELRNVGIESAHAVNEQLWQLPQEAEIRVSEAELTTLANRVARTWSW